MTGENSLSFKPPGGTGGCWGSPSLRDPRRLPPLSLSSPRRSRQHLLRRGGCDGDDEEIRYCGQWLSLVDDSGVIVYLSLLYSFLILYCSSILASETIIIHEASQGHPYLPYLRRTRNLGEADDGNVYIYDVCIL
jgi:hypothetical protein